MCEATLDSGAAFFRCSEECDDVVCETCYDPVGISPHRVDEQTFTPIQPADNPCGIMKVEVVAGQRWLEGDITGVFSCGVVANVRLTGGAKSATHMYGTAGEI